MHKNIFYTKSNIHFLILVVLASTALFALTSCETDEDNKMAKAQNCLNQLRDSSSASDAQNCENIIAGIESAEAYVIRCSVQFWVGGVTSNTLIQAFENYDDASSNADRTNALINGLAQSSNAQAEKTLSYCKKSETPSLEYLATLSFTGTVINTAGGIATCAATPASCDPQAVGEAVISMYDLYCIGDAKDNSACTLMASAISTGGGSSSAVADALFDLLN